MIRIFASLPTTSTVTKQFVIRFFSCLLLLFPNDLVRTFLKDQLGSTPGELFDGTKYVLSDTLFEFEYQAMKLFSHV